MHLKILQLLYETSFFSEILIFQNIEEFRYLSYTLYILKEREKMLYVFLFLYIIYKNVIILFFLKK